MSHQGRDAVVLGLGLTGYSLARYLVANGANVRVADTRSRPPFGAKLAAALPKVPVITGPIDDTTFIGADLIAISPGVAKDQPAIATAVARGAELVGDIELFARALPPEQKVLAITGSNGKTTVAALTGALCRAAGLATTVAGNIGDAVLDSLTAENLWPDVFVLELSSFQLDASACGTFEPDVGALLNVTEDHLDWHGNFAAYGAAKARVFGETALIVVNRDDAAAMALVPPPKTLPPTRKGRPPRIVERRVVTFGANVPERPGDWGLAVENDMAWLARALDDDEVGNREGIVLRHLMPADALRIRGRHNAVNALAALALATAAGCPLAPMLYGLREYRGEPHRVEPVGIIHEVEYFDDSKGTNVGATVAALQGLGADRKVVVILGGDGKGQDFSPLGEPVARHARAVVLIGRDGPQIRAALESTGVTLIDAASMDEAVKLAMQRAHPGDAVLMSPACASFDMFRDYAHRADVFRAAVQAVADDAGVSLEVRE